MDVVVRGDDISFVEMVVELDDDFVGVVVIDFFKFVNVVCGNYVSGFVVND